MSAEVESLAVERAIRDKLGSKPLEKHLAEAEERGRREGMKRETERAEKILEAGEKRGHRAAAIKLYEQGVDAAAAVAVLESLPAGSKDTSQFGRFLNSIRQPTESEEATVARILATQREDPGDDDPDEAEDVVRRIMDAPPGELDTDPTD